ncbi:MurT ligase domain-containing protein [Tomitella cavernea]|uniref:Lipid II isoglutaminyl synthase (glutamine-hydrolyzing) subunit MurT n=1 Tax=Tomitella cavernea TaxID=1387982 RepID=A0ABP9C659_9ACTN|nr:MurT ligase domain-containing protein [Tomitella cavernea]
MTDASPGNPAPGLTLRGRTAMRIASAAAWASRKSGRGKGAMIGGLIALQVDRSIMGQLGAGKRTVLVTGTNGKSTTNRMVAAALSSLGPVATNADGANMDAGLVAALGEAPAASTAALEVDELHVPHVADAVAPSAVVLLNLSRDQLDRVGEINAVERRLREGLARHPGAVLVANADDVLVSSVAFDAPDVVWVAAGAGWTNDSAGCPRCGEPIVRPDAEAGPAHDPHPAWHCSGCTLARPQADWSVDGDVLSGPEGFTATLGLRIPGRANLGNAAQAVAAAVAVGVPPADAARAVGTVTEVAGRYRAVQRGPHRLRMLLAKNPAGWQEALSMSDKAADGLVIAVNGQVPDGEDLSWLWDVDFEALAGNSAPIVAAGERGTDLAVRLAYAGVEHTLEKNVLRAVDRCPPGRVEVLANYTALSGLDRALEREEAAR